MRYVGLPFASLKTLHGTNDSDSISASTLPIGLRKLNEMRYLCKYLTKLCGMESFLQDSSMSEDFVSGTSLGIERRSSRQLEVMAGIGSVEAGWRLGYPQWSSI